MRSRYEFIFFIYMFTAISAYRLVYPTIYSEYQFIFHLENCPLGWIETNRKCLKVLGIKKVKNEAKIACENAEAQMYIPKSPKELEELTALLPSLKLNENNWIWLGLQLKNTQEKRFPPTIARIDNKEPPQWINSEQVNSVWNDSQVMGVNKRVFFKLHDRKSYKYIKMKNGSWSVARYIYIFNI